MLESSVRGEERVKSPSRTSLYLLASAVRYLGEDERAAALHAESLGLRSLSGPPTTGC